MTGILVGEIEVHDPDKYKEYAAKVPAVVAQYGGQYLVRGGDMEVLEGEWPDRRIVVIRFPSMARAREWYFSSEYEPLKAVRMSASTGNLVFVEGVE